MTKVLENALAFQKFSSSNIFHKNSSTKTKALTNAHWYFGVRFCKCTRNAGCSYKDKDHCSIIKISEFEMYYFVSLVYCEITLK
jgi:hypothetical protein